MAKSDVPSLFTQETKSGKRDAASAQSSKASSEANGVGVEHPKKDISDRNASAAWDMRKLK